MKYLVVLFLIGNTILGQLKEFEIKEMDPPETMPVLRDEGQLAAIIFYSSLANLNFSSNVGGIREQSYDQLGNKYILKLELERQSIKVRAPGFMESSIAVRKLEAKTVLFYSIEEKKEAVTKSFGTFIFNSIPSEVNYEIVGYFYRGTTPDTSEYSSGDFQVKFSKEGYRDTTLLVRIPPDETVRKTVEMTPDFGIINAGFVVSNIVTSSEYVSNQEVILSDNGLRISFELADPDEEYNVSLVMKRSTDPEFLFEPQALSGDYGEDIPGGAKEILWASNQEFPDATSTDDLYLEILAEETGWGWLTWSGIAAATAVVGYWVCVEYLCPEETKEYPYPPRPTTN